MIDLHPPVDASTFPFSAVVGADDMSLALILTSVSPEVGGVLIRGEKGTAKSTIVRALAQVLPTQQVVEGCRFGCDPAAPDPRCPDGPHLGARAIDRAARLVELPIGASEDRVVGSLDLERALSTGVTSYEPGLLASANRGILYVDEVNLLHDHLVDLLLDAAAMGRSTVEREGFSVSHAARIVLVGTMNPEEGELRPQLLDRFGLTVEVAAPRVEQQRTEVIRRRLAFDANPESFVAQYADQQRALRERIVAARARVPHVRLSDRALRTIARVCAGFEVDGMRADIVTTRAAAAHAAWHGRDEITRADIRAAALLALPHRRRRNPFDEPGLDEELLDQLLGDDDPPPHDPPPDDGAPPPDPSDNPADPSDNPGDPSDNSADPSETTRAEADQPTEPAPSGTAPAGVAKPRGSTYSPRLLTARGLGEGAAGKRSRALTATGKTIGVSEYADGRRLHLPATLRAAAPHQHARGREGGKLVVQPRDLRRARTQGRESNLVLICVDASGSMGARKRMEQVKTAVLSLLLDAYRRRDKVAVIAFRGRGAELLLPPTSSVEAGARRLETLPHGGRTPLAEGLQSVARLVEVERVRDPKRRPLLVLVTDGRATAGDNAVARSHRAAEHLAATGLDSVVIDCETGKMRLGLARQLAAHLGAEYLPVGDLAAHAIVDAVESRDPRPRAA